MQKFDFCTNVAILGQYYLCTHGQASFDLAKFLNYDLRVVPKIKCKIGAGLAHSQFWELWMKDDTSITKRLLFYLPCSH